MACTLTTGRKLPCKSAFGGIKKVFFADYGDLTAITVDAPTGEATFTGTPTWYEYDVKGNSSLETTVTSSRENGTTFYTQTLNLTLNLFRCFNATRTTNTCSSKTIRSSRRLLWK